MIVINLLRLDPDSLLARALTCKRLSVPAKVRIRKLVSPKIFLSDYTDIDRLVAEIRTSPSRARCIRSLYENGLGIHPALAFPVVPLRLGNVLVNLTYLCLQSIPAQFHAHPTIWYIHGRAFRTVKTLELQSVQFPSFNTFIQLVTSFPSLGELRLSLTSCASRRIAPSLFRIPRTRRTHLDCLVLENLLVNGSNDERWFVSTFIWWFCSSEMLVYDKLQMDGSLLLYPPGHQLVQFASKFLKTLSMTFPNADADPTKRILPGQKSTSRKSSDTDYLLGIFRVGFPDLEAIYLWNIQCDHIPVIRDLFSHSMAHLRRLTISVSPPLGPIQLWRDLDALLFSWLMVRHRVEISVEKWLSQDVYHPEVLLPLITQISTSPNY